VALQQLALHQHYNAMMLVDVLIMKNKWSNKRKIYMEAMSEQMVSWIDNF
jgi:hypothetical protein